MQHGAESNREQLVLLLRDLVRNVLPFGFAAETTSDRRGLVVSYSPQRFVELGVANLIEDAETFADRIEALEEVLDAIRHFIADELGRAWPVGPRDAMEEATPMVETEGRELRLGYRAGGNAVMELGTLPLSAVGG